MFITALCVVGNKTDLPKELRKVSAEKGREYAKSLNSLFAETSAAHDIGKSAYVVCACVCLCICMCCVCPYVYVPARTCVYVLHAYLCMCTCVQVHNFQDGVKLLRPT